MIKYVSIYRLHENIENYFSDHKSSFLILSLDHYPIQLQHEAKPYYGIIAK